MTQHTGTLVVVANGAGRIKCSCGWQSEVHDDGMMFIDGRCSVPVGVEFRNHLLSVERSQENKVPNPILNYFSYDHLPMNLQLVSQPLAELAFKMEDSLPDCAEKSAGLRKLLEAKDCFVRAALEKARQDKA